MSGRSDEPRCGDRTIECRFWAKVDKRGPDDCWTWIGCKSQLRHRADAYGYIRLNGHMQKAHRVSYELTIGPIPDGLTIDHLCRNTLCVNPRHLDPVDMRTNILRGNGWAAKNARKTACPNGHPLPPTIPGKRRECLECRRDHQRIRRDRIRARLREIEGEK